MKNVVKLFKGNEKLGVIFLIVLEGFLLIFFLSSFIMTKKQVFRLTLELRKARQEFTEKEVLLSAQVDGLTAVKKSMEEELAALEAEKVELGAELAETHGSVGELTAQLRLTKKEKEESFKELVREMRKTEMALLGKIDEVSKEKLELQNKLFKLTMVTTGSAEVEGWEGEISDKRSVELGRIVVKPASGGPATGKIIETDYKYGFVIFNLGAEDGIKVNTTAEVYRKKLKISEIVTKEVYPTMSFGVVIQGKTLRRVRKGDKVVYNLSLP